MKITTQATPDLKIAKYTLVQVKALVEDINMSTETQKHSNTMFATRS